MSDDARRACPSCGRSIVRPAREGGVVFLGHGLRFAEDGAAHTRCPNPDCRAPLELVRAGQAPLVIRRLTEPAAVGKEGETASR